LYRFAPPAYAEGLFHHDMQPNVVENGSEPKATMLMRSARAFGAGVYPEFVRKSENLGVSDVRRRRFS
jgi:hypothetical protein